MKKYLTAIAPLLLCLPLCACPMGGNTSAPASGTPAAETSWQKGVAGVQALWPLAQDAITIEFPNLPPAAVKAEAGVSADIAALAATTAPISVAALVADLQTLANALPGTIISPAHKLEFDALTTAASALAAQSGA